MHIVHGVQDYDDYFTLKSSCTGMVGFSSLQKCAVVLICLTYGAAADTQDDYLRIVESTYIKTVYRFCRAVVTVFGPTYLRAPNEGDIAWIMAQNEARGFRSLGCLEASIACISDGRISHSLDNGCI